MPKQIIKKNLSLLFVLFALLLTGLPAVSQNKLLTMDDAFLNRALIPANLKQLTWIPGTDDYAYLKTENKNDKLVTGTAGKNKEKTILSLDDFSDAMQKAGADKQAGFPFLQWRTA